MARQEQVLTVFVASPSDVADERARLEDVIRELNTSWSRELGLRLELVRWETHAFPGTAVDAQAVINNQIPDDFDIFIGIMWCRYGTLTGRAGSGTIEEFERAKARHDEDPSAVRLMVYFKDEPLAPSQIDSEQHAKVTAFRASLGEQGTLYWMYAGIDTFEKFLRMHLTRQLQSWKSTHLQEAQPALISESEPHEEQTTNSDDDFGLIDQMEAYEDAFFELTQILRRLSEATEDIGSRMTARTAEMESSPRDSEGNVPRKDAKRIIAKTAVDFDQYTSRVEAELPLYSKTFNHGVNSLIRVATVLPDISREDTDGLTEGLTAVEGLTDAIVESYDGMAQFRTTLAEFPRMSVQLNKSKRRTVAVLDVLLGEFENGQSLLQEAKTTIQALIETSQGKDDDG